MDGRIFGLDIQLGFDVIMQGIAVFIMFALLSYILFEPVRKILETVRTELQMRSIRQQPIRQKLQS
mgnify:CR=1 FL=1